MISSLANHASSVGKTWPGPEPGVRVKASMEDFRRLAADLRSRFSASAAKTGLGTKKARCDRHRPWLQKERGRETTGMGGRGRQGD